MISDSTPCLVSRLFIIKVGRSHFDGLDHLAGSSSLDVIQPELGHPRLGLVKGVPGLPGPHEVLPGLASTSYVF